MSDQPNRISRAVAIRRALRNLDLAAIEVRSYNAIELELARCFDAGHIAGSGVKNQTEAEQHLAEFVRHLPAYTVHAIGATFGGDLEAAIDAVREPTTLEGVSLDDA